MAGSVRRQLFTQHRQKLNVTDAGLRLRVNDSQATRREVNVGPAQREQLADPKSGERQRRNHHAPVTAITGSSRAV